MIAPADISKATRLGDKTIELAMEDNPMLPLPSPPEIEALLNLPGGDKALADLLTARAKAIANAKRDPLRNGFEFDHWRDADALLHESILLIIFGGNRASKSEYAAKRIVRTAMKYPSAILMCLHESEATSIATQQKLIWKYLPPEIKTLNGKQNPVYKVKYSQIGGFTEGKLALPNRTELHFVSYKQDPGAFEGWELGATQEAVLGAWADENMPLPWLKMLLFRLASRAAKLVWTYAPVVGITSTIKEVLGKAPRTLRTRPAELLAERVNVAGLPKGHMPYIQEPLQRSSRLIYFHSDLNPFGRHYEQIKKLCEGRPGEFIEKRAYGYARDTGWHAFPNFGEWNVIKPEHIPSDGTNYMLTDPAGARNWFALWWRVVPGDPATHYIYREWPDYARYGEWATTSNNPNKLDGDPGPAQNPLGFGPEEYKRLFLREEKIIAPRPVTEFAARLMNPDVVKNAHWEAEMETLLAQHVKNPHGRARVRRSILDGEGLGDLCETIRERLIDPRAGRNQHAAEKGGTCLIDKLVAEQRNPAGEVIGPAMLFYPASGVSIDEGVSMINSLLYWDKEREMVPILNAPRLFVSEECYNTRWALENWTGRDGEHGACKDPVDLVRYGALAEFAYLSTDVLAVTGGGSY